MNASLTKLTKCSTAYFLFMLTNNIHQRPLGFRQNHQQEPLLLHRLVSQDSKTKGR